MTRADQATMSLVVLLCLALLSVVGAVQCLPDEWAPARAAR